ncbi:hypothetical protein K503DRAFT_773844 [Rhizopogon vinicolor AM-OR11-026]|uniref:HTH CENPB-type domain-containing protein n=1 Tax=Rhizopogon vinicolor AM-OR11-026 TaxID=1314800 RepID=A0A1B7MR69_9AGAM|nr:hypothetical protein K503DRAFT_773844 [Rhizopogon vinicolor AM-OR11-026]
MVADKRKPRDKPTPYQRQPKKPKVNDTPTTSAQPAARTAPRQNLTLNDWLAVFAYIDAHPAISQCDIVNHFKSLQSGALTFTQSTLSRKLKERSTLEARINDNPNALSSKRPRIVTRPDVDRALFLWVKQMEEKGEHVNGPMLKGKGQKFEELLEVPEDEQLSGDGWLPSFCKAYKIREHRRHGEAGSADLDAVEVEQLAQTSSRRAGLKIRIPARRPPLAQLTALEDEVAASIQDLKTRNRIFGEPPSVDEFLEPAEEQQVGESFEGGDEAIIAVVNQEMVEKAGQVIGVESDEEDNPQPEVSRENACAVSAARRKLPDPVRKC